MAQELDGLIGPTANQTISHVSQLFSQVSPPAKSATKFPSSPSNQPQPISPPATQTSLKSSNTKTTPPPQYPQVVANQFDQPPKMPVQKPEKNQPLPATLGSNLVNLTPPEPLFSTKTMIMFGCMGILLAVVISGLILTFLQPHLFQASNAQSTAIEIAPASIHDLDLLSQNQVALSPTPTGTPIADPVKVTIPIIEVDASIEPVGINEDFSMEVPKNASKIGWFSPKARPGEVGGAILTAHFDTITGRPAVFYRLEELQPGNDIVIETSDGTMLNFKVQELISAPYNTFPKEIVYQQYSNEKLVLITCDGVWDPIDKTYSNRLVVLADLWPQNSNQ